MGNAAAASITAAGTYTVTVTNANGCTDTESITITEDKTIPTAGITNNTATTVLTCTTTAISVTATGGTSYSWTGGATPTTAANSFTAAGTYTVTVTNANGCTDTESITITQNEKPTLSIGSDITPACGATTADLTAGVVSNGTVTYYSDNTHTTEVTTPTAVTVAQTYYIRATSGDRCTTDDIKVVNAFRTTPTADAPSNVTACDSYTLPSLTVGNYFTGAGGTGTAKFAGNVISSSMTLYVYAETGTTPSCSDEHSFTITITPSSINTTTVYSTLLVYDWNEQSYTESGVYTGSTTNCVTEQLNLTINDSYTLGGSQELFVVTPTGTILVLSVEGSMFINDVKEVIQKILDIPISDQILTFAGKELDNWQTIADYNIQKRSTMYLTISTLSPSTISVTGASSFVYNETAQGPETLSVTGSTGAVTFIYKGTGSTDYLRSINKPTEVGTYEVIASVASDADYKNAASEPFSFVIVEASLCPSSTAVTSSDDQTICVGISASQLTANITTTGVSGSPTYTYQWYYNTTNSNTVSDATTVSGATSSTFTPASMESEVGDRWYFCVGYSTDNGCSQSATDQSLASNVVKVTVNAIITASVSIASDATDNTICAGTSVKFTATPTNGGEAPSYQWYLNDLLIDGEINETYTTSALINDDVVTVVMTSNDTGCLAESTVTSDPITMVVNAIISASVSIASDATDNTICAGSSVTFTAIPTNGGTAPEYQWKLNDLDIEGENNETYTTTALNNDDVVTVVMISNETGCLAESTVTSDPITMVVNDIPDEPIASDVSRCGTGTVSLSATLPVGATSVAWFNESAGGTALSTANPYRTASISATTIYYVESVTATCVSATRTLVTATVYEVPAAPKGTAGSNCGAGVVTISATSAVDGEKIEWYARTTSTVVLFTGTTYTPNITATTSYYAAASSAAGCLSARTEVVATINALPATPKGTAGARCGTGTVVLGTNAVTGTTVDWYDAPTGGSVVAGGTGVTSFTTPSISTTTTYYAQSRNTTTGCVSATRLALTATVNPEAVAGTVSSSASSVCSGTNSTTLMLSDNTGTIQWQSSTDNNAFSSINRATASMYTATNLTAPTYYRALVTNGTCNAFTSSALITVNPVPAAPTGTAGSNCGAGAVTISAASAVDGASIEWYAANTSTVVLFTGATYTPNITATTTYYAAARSAAGCLSARTAVAATINALPAVPTGTAGARCGTGTVVLGANAVTGTTVDWYAAPTGGSVVTGGTGVTSFTTPSIEATTTFYAQRRNTTTGCVSATRVAVIATVNAVPVAPMASDVSRCGPGTVSLSATLPVGATSVAWFNVSIGGKALSTANSYTTASISVNTTYYIESRTTTCISATRTAVLATVNPLPAAPTGTAGSNCGAGTVVISAAPPAGSTIDWYLASTGGTILSGGLGVTTFTTPSISATTTYYAASRNLTTGCVSATRTAVSATINVLLAASASITGTTNICPLVTSGTTTTYTAATIRNAVSYKWTLPAGASIVSPSSTGNVITVKFTSAVANSSITVQGVASTGCVGNQRSLAFITTTCAAPIVLLTSANTNKVQSAPVVESTKVMALLTPRNISFNLNFKSPSSETVPVKIVDATGGVSYSWSGGTTPTTAANSFTEAGTYSVKITNTNGFTDTEKITITKDAYDVIAYPNPSIGIFRLALPGFAGGEARIRIVDEMGRLIRDEMGKVENGKKLREIDLTYDAKGVYFIQVIQDRKVKTIRVIIE